MCEESLESLTTCNHKRNLTVDNDQGGSEMDNRFSITGSMPPQTCCVCMQPTRSYVDYRPAWANGTRVFHYCYEGGHASSAPGPMGESGVRSDPTE